MKLSTSTLGCLKWDLPTTIARLKEYGYDGVDFRGLRGQLKLWELPEFTTHVKETATRLRDAGLTVSCISSGIRLVDTQTESMAAFDDEAARSAEICAALDCRQIRIFGGDLKLADNATESDRPRVIDHVVKRATALATRVRAIAPADLLVETHDSWTHSEHMVEILTRIDRSDVACCWDVKHTYWLAREAPETTWHRLKKWIRNTHWKDARRVDPDAIRDPQIAARVKGPGMLCPVGEGVCPIADFHAVMSLDHYDGWYTLEWEKQWHPHIEEPEVAFPAFVRYMRGLGNV